MMESKKRMSPVASSWWYGSISLVGCLVLSVAVAAAQNIPSGVLAPVPQLSAVAGVRLQAPLTPASQGKTGNTQPAGEIGATPLHAAYSQPAAAPGEARLLTLDQAQQMAAGAGNPLARLGELQVEAARQHRKGVESLYFPNIGSQFSNLHFNKATGDVLTGPLGIHEFSSKIIGKDSTAVNVSAVQPITPLIAIHQLVKIARADENIARAKAGMPVSETASKVEKNYFDLLVAQRELTSAEADAKKIQSKWLTASTGAPHISPEQEADMINAEKAVVVPASKVKELTASLNELLGLPEETKLELTPPEPLVENLSLMEVTDQAMAANVEVVTAEQTAIKAHAAVTLNKLAYGPNVAVTGGYMNQNAVDIVLPRAASYIGVIATYTVFDFGKREHDVSEAKANAKAAELGVQLTKAKVAGAVKSTYFELERSRQFTQLARQMMSATQVVEASYKTDAPEVESARAKVEADMYRSELEYRQTYARLEALMGNK